MNELKLRKATEADYPMIQKCLWDEWPGTEKEDLSLLHTIIAEGVGFVSFYTGKYPFPTMRHLYINPDKRGGDCGKALAYGFTRWLLENGHDRYVILIPKEQPYIEKYMHKIAHGFPASAKMYEEDDNLKYFLLEVNHA